MHIRFYAQFIEFLVAHAPWTLRFQWLATSNYFLLVVTFTRIRDGMSGKPAAEKLAFYH